MANLIKFVEISVRKNEKNPVIHVSRRAFFEKGTGRNARGRLRRGGLPGLPPSRLADSSAAGCTTGCSAAGCMEEWIYLRMDDCAVTDPSGSFRSLLYALSACS